MQMSVVMVWTGRVEVLKAHSRARHGQITRQNKHEDDKAMRGKHTTLSQEKKNILYTSEKGNEGSTTKLS